MCKECGGIVFHFVFCSQYVPDPVKEKMIRDADLKYTERDEDGTYYKKPKSDENYETEN